MIEFLLPQTIYYSINSRNFYDIENSQFTYKQATNIVRANLIRGNPLSAVVYCKHDDIIKYCFLFQLFELGS